MLFIFCLLLTAAPPKQPQPVGQRPTVDLEALQRNSRKMQEQSEQLQQNRARRQKAGDEDYRLRSQELRLQEAGRQPPQPGR